MNYKFKPVLNPSQGQERILTSTIFDAKNIIHLQFLVLDQEVSMPRPRKQIASRLILVLNIKLRDKMGVNLLLLSEVPKPNFDCNHHDMGDTNTA